MQTRPSLEVLHHEAFEEGAFAHAGLAGDMNVLTAIRDRETERLPVNADQPVQVFVGADVKEVMRHIPKQAARPHKNRC